MKALDGALTSAAARTKPVRLASMLGLDSIRGRNLYIAAFFLISLLIAALVANQYVKTTATSTSTKLSNRAQISEVVRRLSNNIWLAENNLQRYMLQPDEALHLATVAMLDRMRIDLETLPKAQWIAPSSKTAKDVHTLITALARLRVEVDRLMIMRTNPSELYPAIPVIYDQLVPAHISFYNTATLAMDDADLLSDIPAQQQVYRQFAAVRHTWTMMILSFRSYMSFRSGLFPGDSQTGARTQLQHIDNYNESLSGQLDQLAEMDKRGLLEFQQTDTLRTLRIEQKKMA